ncbi:MAG: hypothetical protein M0R80_31850 [Proteobacteria bacterium]|jgi:hypothetical protein|nr:hypothetical protein [Pseudomonadota bacterium]
MAAATYDLSVGGTTALPCVFAGKVAVVEKTVDFAVDGIGNTETADVINIPANTLVLGVSVYVNTAESTDTIDVGDSDTAALYIDDGSLAVADVTLWSDGSAGTGRILVAAKTKYYTAANAIRVLANAALATGKITVRALMVQFTP